MNCTDLQHQLDDLIDGNLSTEAERALRTHALGCDTCRAELGRSEALQEALGALPVEPAAEGFEKRVLEYATARSSSRARVVRGVGGALIAACAASVLTLALLGPHGQVPSSGHTVAVPVVAMTIDEPRKINLVFASNTAVDEVSLTVELPSGVEIAGYAGRREVRWRTSMQTGKNYLPLELVARESASGQLVARVRHGDAEKVFRVFVTAAVG